MSKLKIFLSFKTSRDLGTNCYTNIYWFKLCLSSIKHSKLWPCEFKPRVTFFGNMKIWLYRTWACSFSLVCCYCTRPAMCSPQCALYIDKLHITSNGKQHIWSKNALYLCFQSLSHFLPEQYLIPLFKLICFESISWLPSCTCTEREFNLNVALCTSAFPDKETIPKPQTPPPPAPLISSYLHRKFDLPYGIKIYLA